MARTLSRSLAASWLAVSVLGTSRIGAQSAAFAHEDGTTHRYEAVLVPSGITFQEAHVRAAQAGGYLATITSAGEALAVFRLVDRPEYWTMDAGALLGPWLGGLQAVPTHEPAGGWAWGEREPFAFTNWTAGQPDDDFGADRICLGGAATRQSSWADTVAAHKLMGFIIEYSGPTALRTVGLLAQEPGSFEGYRLFSPLQTKDTYLVDARGRAVHRWQSDYTPGASVYLEPSGHILRAGRIVNPAFQGFGGDGGVIEEFDWQGNRVWQFTYSTVNHVQHHDIERLPNGNVLMIAWEKVTRTAAIAAGRDPGLLPSGELWPGKVVEVEPTGPTSGRVVWEWRAFDHLIQDHDPGKANYGVVGARPERIDVNHVINGGVADWLHINAIAYNPALDQIVLSVRSFSELWIIDHSTTTAEAATSVGGRSGKGGDLLYRWGNPRSYRAGTEADRTLFWQHDAHWIADGLPGAGRMLVFNNGGSDRPGGPHSSVDEIELPAIDARGNYARPGPAWGPLAPVWSYVATPRTSFYSAFVSGAERLPNGNTLICAGWNGNMFEVTPTGNVLCSYTNPIAGTGIGDEDGVLRQGDVPAGNMVFRSPGYAPDHPALRGRTFPTREPLEAHDTVLLADGSTLRRDAPIGSVVRLDVRAPEFAGATYLVVSSLSPGLSPVDTRMLRLGFDAVASASATGQLPAVFQNYLGQLDGAGHATAQFALPALAGLAGLTFLTSFVVIDESAPSAIGLIANTVEVRVTR